MVARISDEQVTMSPPGEALRIEERCLGCWTTIASMESAAVTRNCVDDPCLNIDTPNAVVGFVGDKIVSVQIHQGKCWVQKRSQCCGTVIPSELVKPVTSNGRHFVRCDVDNANPAVQKINYSNISFDVNC